MVVVEIDRIDKDLFACNDVDWGAIDGEFLDGRI